MLQIRRLCAAALPILASAIVACDGDPAAPKTTAPASTFTGTTGAVYNQPSDTTPLASGPATIRGTVVLITVTPSNGQPVDTSHTAPLAGARLSLSRRVREGDGFALVPYSQKTADAGGVFDFGEVPSDYYVLKAEGPSGTSYHPAQAYIVTSVGSIAVDFRLVTGM
jgi:hypothetical protein